MAIIFDFFSFHVVRMKSCSFWNIYTPLFKLMLYLEASDNDVPVSELFVHGHSEKDKSLRADELTEILLL